MPSHLQPPGPLHLEGRVGVDIVSFLAGVLIFPHSLCYWPFPELFLSVGSLGTPCLLEFGPLQVGVLLPVTKQRWHEWVQLTCFFLLEVWVPATFSSFPPSRSAVGSMPVRSGWIQPAWSKWPPWLPHILSIYASTLGLLRSLNMLLTFSPTVGRAQSAARAGSRHHSTDLPSHRMPNPSKANTSTHTGRHLNSSALLPRLCIPPRNFPECPPQCH